MRSRTYEAFFPLITVTVICFILETLFRWLIRLIQKRLDPQSRRPGKILKGVRTDA